MRKTHGDLYKQHLQLIHTKFSCYKCDKFFYTSAELSEHSATHGNDEKSFKCPYCRASFYTFSEVTKHRRWDCNKRLCPCKDCGAVFPNPSRLIHHRMEMHSTRGAVVEDTSPKCWKCNRVFQTDEELLEHQEKNEDCTNCVVVKQYKKRGRKPKNKAPEEIVEKKVKTEGDNCTVKEEKTEMEIPCSEAGCDLVFPSVDALRAHKKDQHVRASRTGHACSECDETFAELDKLNIHMAKDHCSVEYACPTCGEGFSEESALIDHMSSHCKKEEPDH